MTTRNSIILALVCLFVGFIAALNLLPKPEAFSAVVIKRETKLKQVNVCKASVTKKTNPDGSVEESVNVEANLENSFEQKEDISVQGKNKPKYRIGVQGLATLKSLSIAHRLFDSNIFIGGLIKKEEQLLDLTLEF